MRTRILVAGCFVSIACAGPAPRARGAPGPAATAHTGCLRAYLRGPSRATYLPATLGAERQTVDVRLVNEGKGTVDVRGLRALFTAHRGRVAFPCAAHDDTFLHGREATSLRPGRSFTFVRRLDCATPLPGHYDVTMRIELPGWRASDGSAVVGGFPLEVVTRSEAPRAYPGREGLYVMMTGAPKSRPLPPEGWARGDYHLFVAVVNGGPAPVRVGRARVAFRTYREGALASCAGQGNELSFPAVLEPGATCVLPAPLACAPAEEGVYVIVGSIALADDTIEMEAGRFRLTVSSDPLLFAPSRLPPWDERPLQ